MDCVCLKRSGIIILLSWIWCLVLMKHSEAVLDGQELPELVSSDWVL